MSEQDNYIYQHKHLESGPGVFCSGILFVMETIEHNGSTFVKATTLAKKYRYTTDYIGQLCRSGKVEAKLIGRAWFVNEKSLMSHKNDRYNNTRSSEIVINKSLVSDRETHSVTLRREVRPVLLKSTHRSILHAAEPKTYNFESRGTARVSTYHQDDDMLKPGTFMIKTTPVVENKAIISEEIPHKINVSVEERGVRKLLFEDLPEVALRGDLSIDSLDDPDLFAEVEPVSLKNIKFAPESVVRPKVLVTKRYQPKPSVHEVAVSQVNSKVVVPNVEKQNLSQSQLAHVKVAADIVTPTIETPVRFIIVPILMAVAILGCVVILGLASHAETDGVELRQSLAFSVASVLESVLKLAESY